MINPFRLWTDALTAIKGPRAVPGGGKEYFMAAKVIGGHILLPLAVGLFVYMLVNELVGIETAKRVALVASIVAIVVFEVGDVVRYIQTNAHWKHFADSVFDVFELSGAAWMFAGLLMYGPIGLLALPIHVAVVVLVSPIRGKFG